MTFTREQYLEMADTLEEWLPMIHSEVAKKAAVAVTKAVAMLRSAADAPTGPQEPEGVRRVDWVCSACGRVVCKPGCERINPIGGDY